MAREGRRIEVENGVEGFVTGNKLSHYEAVHNCFNGVTNFAVVEPGGGSLRSNLPTFPSIAFVCSEAVRARGTGGLFGENSELDIQKNISKRLLVSHEENV